MVCKPCLFNINQPTCEAERYHGTYLPLNLLSEPEFKHANVLVDFGRFDLALLWIIFSVRLAKHEDPQTYQDACSRCHSKWSTFCLRSGIWDGWHFHTNSQIVQPHSFGLIRISWFNGKTFSVIMNQCLDKLATWLDDWLSLRQLLDQTGPTASIFAPLKYREVTSMCVCYFSFIWG